MPSSRPAHLRGFIFWKHHLNIQLLLAMGCHAINCNSNQTSDKKDLNNIRFTALVKKLPTYCIRKRLKKQWEKYSCLANEWYQQFLWKDKTCTPDYREKDRVVELFPIGWNILIWKDQKGLEAHETHKKPVSLVPHQDYISNKQLLRERVHFREVAPSHWAGNSSTAIFKSPRPCSARVISMIQLLLVTQAIIM